MIDAIKSLFRPIAGWSARKRFMMWFDGRPEDPVQWLRVVMNREVRRLVEGLPLETMSVLELSGVTGRSFPRIRQYRCVDYPDYDICTVPLPDKYDLIIAEQVFEHLLWPRRAVENVYAMLSPGGYFLITTPFLVPVHYGPVDCSRWTETGLKYLLAEGGFPLEHISAGSWGNQQCARANLKHFATYRGRFHSLRNDAKYPVSVWALARKPA
jgi:SAM-dependent methyltransferase